MTSFQHLLITRFNIRISRDTHVAPSSDWVRSRMQLFEHYCLPSVMHQTCQTFRWLVLLDESTPIDVKQHMQNLQQQCPVMQVMYVPPIADLSVFYHELVVPYATAPYLLTTRLDNDDMIATTYIEQIQSIAKSNLVTALAVSFPHGIQLFLKDSVALGLQWKENHFVSLLEKVGEDMQTVLDYDHTSLAQFVPVHYEQTSAPMWAEVVHGANVTNDFSPHCHPRIEHWHSLPFAGDWLAFLHTGKNYIFLIRYYWHYRKRSIRNLLRRLVG